VETFDHMDFTLVMKRDSRLVMESVNPEGAELLALKNLEMLFTFQFALY